MLSLRPNISLKLASQKQFLDHRSKLGIRTSAGVV